RFYSMTMMSSEAKQSPLRVVFLFAGGLTLLLALAWLSETLLLVFYQFQDWERVGRRALRYLAESGYGVRPLAWLAVCWSFFAAIGLLPFSLRHTKVYRVIAAVIVGLLLLWPMARVIVYYYMRLELTPELAIYGLVELRRIIFTVSPGAVWNVPWIPLLFLPLIVLVGIWAWWMQRTFPHRAEHAHAHPWRWPVVGLLTLIVCTGPLLAHYSADREDRSVDRSERRVRPAEGPSPFPPAEEMEIKLFPPESHFYEQFGFHLPENTNVVFIILESAREEFVDLSRTKYFAPELSETIQATHFFAPVPHSSNSHYSLFMGMHGARDFEEVYRDMNPAPGLPIQLNKYGYTNYYIYTDHTSFESETEMLRKFEMRITEKNHFVQRVNPETNQPYKSFNFGLDDIALVHETARILDEEQEPYTISVVLTNSHYPYLNPDPENFNRFDNNTILGRHRNGIDYGLHVADRIVAEVEKRGMADRTLFVLMSDHGESFGEHGYQGHSFSIYNQEVRVPLVMRHPEFRRVWQDNPLPRGAMIDVYPTVFDMLGLKPPTALHGRSMFDPEYDFHLPLWVWRVDDFRGFILSDTKWVYDDLEEVIYQLDLYDKREKSWVRDDFDEHAEQFISVLMSLDMGTAAGQSGAAGDTLGPTLRMGPYTFGGSFKGGGGRLYTDCDQLPVNMECADDDYTGAVRGDPERNIPVPTANGQTTDIPCNICVGP
ncbi:MAG: sulfatase-like hydrolase/transferase, partial [Leptospiraceae bacterium]|nr:sulfatase-like hydrolase/transferase [Leptospiraceae bacterium]